MQLKRRSLSESSVSLMSNDQINTGINLRRLKQIKVAKFYSKDSNYSSSSSSITYNNNINNINNILLRKQANSLKFDQLLVSSDDDDDIMSEKQVKNRQLSFDRSNNAVKIKTNPKLYNETEL
jgi:hypothetical protein